ncbi:MAG TPA: hypothetical protein VH025_07615 [Solirubrobacteraceae bacterium]|jgi:hypothetical protein|nr:hypothetical protein [Solirubrobacteraceae bacterium]
MATLACLMHWYVSLLYVVPVVAVGGWGWWSARRMSRRRPPGRGDAGRSDAAAG